MLKSDHDDSESADNVVVRLARRFMHTTGHHDGDRLFTVVDGTRAMTPMLLVVVAIGGTDILFALESIPAIFGLTQNTYLVFTAVAFSRLGLRQLFFLIEGLLDRLTAQDARIRLATSRRRTLPIGLVGSSSTKTTRRGTL